MGVILAGLAWFSKKFLIYREGVLGGVLLGGLFIFALTGGELFAADGNGDGEDLVVVWPFFRKGSVGR